ncbi:MFS transporter [Clostridium baratii]|uniref:L-lactate MFS transporter n=1 Tax=Clostridium baratii TaxID=1561 RepID=UPI0009A2B5E9|nr:OFA family MFS transporter [Clostridium baratii]OPF50796.1 MFS transporter [Clostridium baratii]OPF54586.1 MFS transporter [Clostridium baratii]OPF54892.1 MFS transporter [Clostridium baratii]OPF59105.1 MFS transporter [Clostridium baratii]
MHIDKKRWVILIAACLINLCLGSLYAWSVFASSMTEYFNNTLHLNITVGNLAIVYTIANAVGPITMISGGWFNDHLGPKKVIALGGIMFGGGMILSGFATSVNFLIVSYGLVTGLGLGMAYGSTISTCVKYFPDKRGLIGGITTAVYGLSSVILPPVITIIVNKWNAPFAFKSIGIVFLVVVVVCTLFLEQCPEGYMPEGYVAPKTQTASKSMNWKAMMKTPIFYIMLLLLTSGAFSGMMIISQASAVAKNMVGMSAIAASAAVSTLALFNAFGRILAGYISDKIGRINTLMSVCVLSIIGLICLYFSGTGTILTFYIGIAIVGLSFGSFMGVYPGFTADQFGVKYNSVNYGIMFIGFALAGYFGPQIMNSVYSSTGSYQNAFLIACGLSVAGVILSLIYKKVDK